MAFGDPWLPMETAPKATTILLCTQDEEDPELLDVVIAIYGKYYFGKPEAWWVAHVPCEQVDRKPICWTHLPPRPKTDVPKTPAKSEPESQ